jgi:hypothetical protein
VAGSSRPLARKDSVGRHLHGLGVARPQDTTRSGSSACGDTFGTSATHEGRCDGGLHPQVSYLTAPICMIDIKFIAGLSE